MSLYDPVGMPRTLRGTPSHIELATVSVVNSDGTIDAQMVGRTAIKSQLEVPRWYKPVKGDRILTTDIAGDQNRPIVIAFVSDEKGSSKEPQGGFTNPSEPKTELVSALPGSPVDGQQVYFQNTAMGTAGIVWHLRYRSASSSPHKWEFVGGGLWTSGQTGLITTSSISFVELTTGPEITTPLTGIYEMTLSGAMVSKGPGVNNMIINVFLGAVESFGTTIIAPAENGGGYAGNSSLVEISSGTRCFTKVRSANTVSTTFENARLTLQPRRVG